MWNSVTYFIYLTRKSKKFFKHFAWWMFSPVSQSRHFKIQGDQKITTSILRADRIQQVYNNFLLSFFLNHNLKLIFHNLYKYW